MTFRYQELSEAGVPRFPSWVGVRHDVAAKPAPGIPKSPAASPTKPRYFEVVSGTSSKFWEISQAGSTMTTRWGRIGTRGQNKTKTFADEPTAAKAAAKLLEEKTCEGYVECEK